ncbi:hypothetical protein KIW84_014943 [Lathyrus oleraceus]|uniref:Retrovirus-related Pol polyprotein from transposon TNT 1-94-like beta-barrel domain-containing protein n=1 Tax=Pisum sativum TaxID=3888 RepID=A0A9D5BPF2_PEA|nr:hypothetical protein KIW84_014943 [Pisum sativum]
MQDRFTEKFGKEKAKRRNSLPNDEKSRKNLKNYCDSIKKVMGNKKRESREKDDDKVQYAHAGESDFDDMLLMEYTQSNNEQTNMWYLDLGSSNHMLGNKNWFTKLDESIKKVIKFTDGIHVT